MKNQLYHHRRKSGISQAEMAERVGVHRTAYRKHELGETEMRLSDAKIVADTLNITLDHLYEMLTTFEVVS